MTAISDEQRRARLAARHRLAPTARASDVLEAVSAMTCLHATEPASVYLSVFARCEASREDIDKALYVDRSVVRQLAMRRTVFAFPRSLLPAVWGSAAKRVALQQRARLAKEVVSGAITSSGEAWVERNLAAVLALVAERGPMTTMQLRAELPELDARITYALGKSYGTTIPIAPRVLTTLAAEGTIVRGDNAGGWKTSRPRWTVTEQWLGEPAEPVSEREGYAQLVTSWLRTFGPGSETDLVWWLGATKSAVRRALDDVAACEVGLQCPSGATGWVLPDDTQTGPRPEPWAALLPVLDPTVMGWRHRGFYLGPHAERLFDVNGNAGTTAWWDGRIVGGWHQLPDGEVRLLLLEDLGAEATTALQAQADRLTAWLDGEVVKSVYASPLVRSISRTRTK
ncbi:MAG: winged helix DNA-binding domain-containing protein [Actinomycetota bacterium]|nr:winged helix DNA-binding domain-containing protein [Actinomycetota bacterium]